MGKMFCECDTGGILTSRCRSFNLKGRCRRSQRYENKASNKALQALIHGRGRADTSSVVERGGNFFRGHGHPIIARERDAVADTYLCLRLRRSTEDQTGRGLVQRNVLAFRDGLHRPEGRWLQVQRCFHNDRMPSANSRFKAVFRSARSSVWRGRES